MKNEITTTQETEASAFELAQRQAKALQTSDLLPSQFKGNLGNILIAMEYAKRLDMPPLAIMQSVYVVNGKPGFSGQFFIAQIIKRYGSINYEMSGTGDDMACSVWTEGLEFEKVSGPVVSIAMAKSEGWYSKAGSKWLNMPDLMLRYRAAAFFARVFLPDLILGLQTVDEIRDITLDPETGAVQTIRTRGIRGLKQRLTGGGDEN